MLVHELPKYYIVEPTNFCNFTCPICPNNQYTRENQGNMEMDLFVTIIEQIKKVAEVIQLYWMGEPLLNPSIYDMIKYCKNNTCAKVMISTNGSNLSPESIDLLIESGLDEIIISVDASDSQEIYESIRVGGDLSELNSTIRLLLKHNEHLHVVLQFIDLYINRTEKASFLHRWRDKNCSLQVSCLYTWANQIPSLNLASDNLSPVAKKQRVPCADLWNKLSIHWNGLVSTCCFDWNFTQVIGNCYDNRLIDIWNSGVIRTFRNKHLNLDFSAMPLCLNCDSWAEPEEYISLYHLGNEGYVGEIELK